jgi:hypothetical protein
MKIKLTVRDALSPMLVPTLNKLGADTANTPLKMRYRLGRTVKSIQSAVEAAQKKEAELFKQYGEPDGAVCLRRIEELRAEIEAANKPNNSKELAIKKLEERVASYLVRHVTEPLVVAETHPERAAFDAARDAALAAVIETEIEDNERLKVVEAHKLTGEEMVAVEAFIAVE